jgi:hypothetical protein
MKWKKYHVLQGLTEIMYSHVVLYVNRPDEIVLKYDEYLSSLIENGSINKNDIDEYLMTPCDLDYLLDFVKAKDNSWLKTRNIRYTVANE